MNRTWLSRTWLMDWRWRTGRKLADTLHISPNFFLIAEVKYDGTVGTVGILILWYAKDASTGSVISG